MATTSQRRSTRVRNPDFCGPPAPLLKQNAKGEYIVNDTVKFLDLPQLPEIPDDLASVYEPDEDDTQALSEDEKEEGEPEQLDKLLEDANSSPHVGGVRRSIRKKQAPVRLTPTRSGQLDSASADILRQVGRAAGSI
eukprot:SAG31_NODE_131_length_23419_cov_38.760087_13_plen_137_part_00